MKPTTLLILLLSISFANCQSKPEPVKKNYELVADDDGIIVEKFAATVIDENKYNHNNTVYKVGNSFKYKFEHRTTDNEKKYFEIINEDSGWVFVNETEEDANTIKSVIMEVANGNPLADHVPDYSQTCLVYKISKDESYSTTGAIENEANTWIHPPREKYFEILELNPFPYIKAPYEIGTKWTWKLGIGDSWADGRWKLWTGSIENKYTYEITGQETLKTTLGDIECFVIESEATSRIGETSLTAYFNEKYGFVKLAYTNIDGSKTNLELIEYSEGKSEE